MHAPHRVLIVGAGVAALEGALALRALAGDLVDVELVSPSPTFTYRPLAVLEPFRDGAVRRFALEDVAAHAQAAWRRGRVVAIDSWAQTARTDGGGELSYDSLLLALGAKPESAVPGAVTFVDQRSVADVERLLEDLRSGDVRTVAFVVPPGVAWALPAYELALMTVDWSRRHDLEARVAVVTAEPEPLAAFGADVCADVKRLLDEGGVQLATERVVDSVEDGRAWMGAGGSFAVDRVIALPALRGWRLEGVPADDHGFVPVDEHGAVHGVPGVFAAGDITSHPVKQGGLAAQQADAAAAAIARRAGADAAPEPFQPTLRAVLLTGGAPRYLRAGLSGGEVGDDAPWWPPAKIVGRHLAPALAELADAGAARGG